MIWALSVAVAVLTLLSICLGLWLHLALIDLALYRSSSEYVARWVAEAASMQTCRCASGAGSATQPDATTE